MKRVAGAAASNVAIRSMEGRTIACDRRLQSKIAACSENSRPVVAEQAVDQNHVARPGAMGAEVDILADRADAGRRDEHLVARGLVHDFGVARDDLNPGLMRGAGHRTRNLPDELDRQPFLDDDRTGEIERHRAPDREIIHGSTDGELSDIAAGEDQGIDDERIGGESQAITMTGKYREIEPRLVIERRKQRVVERLQKYVVDEIFHRLAAAAMGKRYRRHMDLAARPPGNKRSDVHAAPTSMAASLRCRFTPPYW